MFNKSLTFIERMANLEPHLEHQDYEKCALCLKQVINFEVAKEMISCGKKDDSYMKEYEREVNKRFQNSFIFKEIHRIKSTGKTLDEAVSELEKMGYIP